MPTLPILGRRGFAQGPVTARGAGNSVKRSQAKGEAAAYPGATPGIPPAPPVPLTTAQQQSSAHAYGGRAFRFGRLIASDRHIIERQGRTTTSAKHATPRSGIPNPEADGPPRPSAGMLNRTFSFQQGTDDTRNLDNDAQHASVTMATGRRFPLANQGAATWTDIYGGTPGLVRPYGARGTGVVGPAPRVVSLPGGPNLPGVVLQAGSSKDGPQEVSGGEPHGRHSPTYPDAKQTQARARAIPQIRHGYTTRPANSKRAGQSMSQFAVPLSGHGGGPVPTANGGRQAGVTGRFVARLEDT